MDQLNQENELQKAIDDITKNGGLPDAEGDAAAELEAKIQDQMGTPPVPPMPAAGDGPAGAMPPADGATDATAPVEGAEMPQIVGSNGEVGAEPAAEPVVTEEAAAEVVTETVPETPEAPIPEMPSMPDATTTNTNMGGDINSVKEAMLRDLFPLMDKVDMGAEEKFELYKTMIDSSNDKSMISAAYEAAKGIADEKQKAEALLFLIRKADA